MEAKFIFSSYFANYPLSSVQVVPTNLYYPAHAVHVDSEEQVLHPGMLSLHKVQTPLFK